MFFHHLGFDLAGLFGIAALAVALAVIALLTVAHQPAPHRRTARTVSPQTRDDRSGGLYRGVPASRHAVSAR